MTRNVLIFDNLKNIRMVDFWQTVEFYGVIVSLIVGSVASYFAWLSNKTQKNQRRMNILFKIFELLNSVDQRTSRGIIFKEYCKVHPTGKKLANEQKLIFSGKLKLTAQKVRDSFNQVGILLDQCLIDKKLFFELYAGMVIRTWIALEEDIISEREKNPKISSYFEILKNDSENYLRMNYEEVPNPYCWETLSDFEQKKGEILNLWNSKLTPEQKMDILQNLDTY